MKERKNLDRLFQEKFKDFERNPDEQVWKNIEAALHQKKKRRVIPIWFRAAGVAAVLLLGLFAWNSVFHDPSGVLAPAVPENPGTSGNPVVSGPGNGPDPQPSAAPSDTGTPDTNLQSPSDTRPDGTSGTSLTPSRGTAVAAEDGKTTRSVSPSLKTGSPRVSASQNQIASVPGQSKASQKTTQGTVSERREAPERQNGLTPPVPGAPANEGIATVTSTTKQMHDTPLGITPTVPSQNNMITDDSVTKDLKRNESIAAANVIDSAKIAAELEELKKIQDGETEKDVIAAADTDKWQVTTNIAPVYFGSASNGSPLDRQFASNSKSYENNLSYGVGVNYAVNKRLSVRTGVNKVSMGYNTNDIVFFAALDGTSNLEAIRPASGSGINVMSASVANSNLEAFEQNIRVDNEGTVNQQMGYYEVPLELSYKLLDRRFSISVIGGLSTLFLDENNVSVRSEQGVSARIGQAENLNDVHFSSNLGLGFRYRLVKSLEIHCEPTFKYQINTFSGDAGNFKPYIVGIYSGLSFSF